MTFKDSNCLCLGRLLRNETANVDPLDVSPKDLLQRTVFTFGFLTGMLAKDDIVLGFPEVFFKLTVEKEEARSGLNRFVQNGLLGQDLLELILPLPFKKLKFRSVSTNSIL